jgi:hypothetical protein
MFTFAIRTVLAVSILVGGIIAIRQGQVYRGLHVEKARLTKLVGALPIVDPSKIYVRRIPTDETGTFVWRIYLPADYAEEDRYRTNSGWGSSQSAYLPVLAREQIFRVSFRTYGDRRLGVFTLKNGNSRLFDIDVPPGLDLTSGSLLQLITDSLGDDFEIREYDTNQVVFLLNARWPAADAKKFSESPHFQTFLDSPALEFGFASPEAWRIHDEATQRNK